MCKPPSFLHRAVVSSIDHHSFYVKWKLLNVNGVSTEIASLSTYNEIGLAVKEHEGSDPVFGFMP